MSLKSFAEWDKFAAEIEDDEPPQKRQSSHMELPQWHESVQRQCAQVAAAQSRMEDQLFNMISQQGSRAGMPLRAPPPQAPPPPRPRQETHKQCTSHRTKQSIYTKFAHSMHEYTHGASWQTSHACRPALALVPAMMLDSNLKVPGVLGRKVRGGGTSVCPGVVRQKENHQSPGSCICRGGEDRARLKTSAP